MSGISKSFGRRVRAMRKAKGMTQEQLGNAAQIDYKHIGVIERGEKSPTLETIERIAKSLGAKPYELLTSARPGTELLELSARIIARRPYEIPHAVLAQFLRDVVAALQRIETTRPP